MDREMSNQMSDSKKSGSISGSNEGNLYNNTLVCQYVL